MRELKTRQQISQWITQRLQIFPDCAGANVTVQYELQEPDAEGCNGSHDLVLNYGDSDSGAVIRHLRPLHQEVRRRFNVSEP